MDKTLQQNRINKVIEAIIKVARGDYSVQIELSSENDSLDSLAMGFNMMVEDLSKTTASRDELDAANQQLAASEQHLRANNQQLQAGEQQLKAANQQLQSEITEREKTEELLWESQEHYRALVDNTALGITIMDTNHKIIMANATFAKLFKKPVGYFVGKYCFREYEKRKAVCSHCPGVRAMASGKTAEVETQAVLDDGTRIDVRNRAIPFFGQDGVVKGFIELVEDITDRKKAEQALKASNKNLEDSIKKLNQLNQQLQEFVYIASHDLREPSRKVSSFGEILAESLAGKLSDDEQENLDFMIDGAERMQQMVDSLLVYSRVTTKDVAFEEVDLNEMIEQLKGLELADNLEETRGTVLVPEPLPSINGDVSQIRQLLQNLIANALKYRKKDVLPEITIRTYKQDDNMVRVEVQDNGIGIEEKQYNNVFVMFRRLHSRQEYDGTGIGLAVCKKIVERHNGEIGVSSTYGQGSTFWFTIPAAKTAGREQEQLVSSLTS